MSYNPTDHGAKCHQCPLNKCKTVVPPEIKDESTVLFVGDVPGSEDVKYQKPFAGKSGMELERNLKAIGRSRKDVSITNAVLCKPEGDTKMDQFMIQFNKENKKRIKKRNHTVGRYETWSRIANQYELSVGQLVAYNNAIGDEELEVGTEVVIPPLEPIANPYDCCLPRLEAEVDRFVHVMPMGNESAEAVLGKIGKDSTKRGGILKLQGAFFEFPRTRLDESGIEVEALPLKVIPTVSPSFVLRAARYRNPFRADMARMFRWREDKLKWRDATMWFSFCLNNDAVEAGRRCTKVWKEVDIKGSTTGDYLEEYIEESEFWVRLAKAARMWQRRGYVTWDTETVNRPGSLFGSRGPEPLTANVRTLQLGDKDEVFVIAFEDIDGTPLFEKEALVELLEWLRAKVFENPDVEVRGQNSGYYDTLLFEAFYQRTTTKRLAIAKQFDCIMAHRDCEPELPHGLSFMGHYYTDVREWKGNHTATEAKNLTELAIYGSIDIQVTDIVATELKKELKEKKLDQCFDLDTKFQKVCSGLHRVGQWVDPLEAKRQHAKLLEQEKFWHAEFIKQVRLTGVDPDNFADGLEGALDELRQQVADYFAAGLTKRAEALEKREVRIQKSRRMNPHSPFHISKLWFDVWDLPLPKNVQQKDLFTASMDRSTNDAVARAYVGDSRLTEAQRAAIHAYRLTKRARKTRSTFVEPVMEGDDSFVWPDGRIRSNWKAHGTAIGRPATSEMNVLNVPKAQRAIFTAEKGRAYVGADSSALHLRLIGHRWNIPSLQEAFLRPRKWRDVILGPHELFAGLIYEDDFWNSPDGTWPSENDDRAWKGDAKENRDVAKTVRYAGAYGGGLGTLFREVTSAEDKKTGRLLYPDMTMDELEAIYDTWMTKEPEWQKGWQAEIDLWNKQGLCREPVFGRIKPCADGADGENKNEIINAPILMLEGVVMLPAIVEISEAIPFEYAGRGTGLVNTNYDSVLVECPADDAVRVAQITLEAMNRELPGFTIPFAGEVDTAYWEEDEQRIRPEKVKKDDEPDRRPSWNRT